VPPSSALLSPLLSTLMWLSSDRRPFSLFTGPVIKELFFHSPPPVSLDWSSSVFKTLIWPAKPRSLGFPSFHVECGVNSHLAFFLNARENQPGTLPLDSRRAFCSRFIQSCASRSGANPNDPFNVCQVLFSFFEFSGPFLRPLILLLSPTPANVLQ